MAYVRFSFKGGGHKCSFVMSKSRIAPLKVITLPRLELSSARIGARLSKLVVHEIGLPIEKIQYWSDSTITLQYIKNKKHRLRVFEANRVSDIHEISEPEQWNKIDGSINPADLLTRGVLDPKKLMLNRWFEGPEQLEKDEETWDGALVDELDPEDPAIRKTAMLVAMGIIETDRIDLSRFSDWLRLRRVIAWDLRFAANFQVTASERNLEAFLDAQEIGKAELFLIRDVQQSAFDKEIRLIRAQKPLPASSRLSPLSPMIGENSLLRVGGRLKMLELPSNVKHPPILPREHPVSKMIIEWIHRKNGHVGPEHVLSLLREQYWVISARTAINQVIHRCFFCQVRRAQRQCPIMADLPLCRAAVDQPPFDHTGVDLFGPVTVKQGRKRLKRWVVLFTCMTVRCVHLEVVESCETDSFINSTRRFVNRRGCPSNVYSDNGTNFRGATAELHEVIEGLDKTAIRDFASTLQIQWHFNPPKAPHMGGAWERLVRSVKEVLYGLTKDHVLTDPQLLTFLTEAESIVNSRPLTHLSEDPSDFEALTPNHILLGKHRDWGQIVNTSEVDITSRKKWRQVQAMRALFWKRWVKEYLPTLTIRSKWRRNAPNVKTGALVLAEEDDIKPGKWPLARIKAVRPGKDGVVRVVEIQTKKGVYTRPVAKLRVLEENHDDDEDDVRGSKYEPVDTDAPLSSVPPVPSSTLDNQDALDSTTSTPPKSPTAPHAEKSIPRVMSNVGGSDGDGLGGDDGVGGSNGGGSGDGEDDGGGSDGGVLNGGVDTNDGDSSH